MHKILLAAVLFTAIIALLLIEMPQTFAAVKDQSRISPPSSKLPASPKNNNSTPGNLFENGGIPKLEQRPSNPPEGVEPPAQTDEFNVEDIPALEQIELTLDIAKRAIDTFLQVGSKYDDKGLNDYPTLKEFVDKTDAGKQLQKEVQGNGFKDIVEWNTAIMNVSFAYSALHEDQKSDIKAQIAAVKESTKLTDDKKLRIIASLNALIPSKDNIKVLRELNELPEYSKKLEVLNVFE